MTILAARVNWNEAWLNLPTIEVLVDKLVPNDAHVYDTKDNLFLSVVEGQASYFYWAGPGDGYGGRVFVTKMRDGSIRKMAGPWSSRAGCVNKAGFGHTIVDCSVTDSKIFYETGKGGIFYATAITLELAITAAKMAGCTLAPTASSTEISWHASLDPRAVVKPYSDWGSKKRAGYRVHNGSGTTLEFKTIKEVRKHLCSLNT